MRGPCPSRRPSRVARTPGRGACRGPLGRRRSRRARGARGDRRRARAGAPGGRTSQRSSGLRPSAAGSTRTPGRARDRSARRALPQARRATAVAEVLEGRAPAVFCAVRPPGHHAGAARPMGFCLTNAAAVATHAALATGVERVCVLDWDVHHGNGTQDLFVDDPRVLAISLHQSPLWPGTGGEHERGVGAGAGATVNITFPAGTGPDGVPRPVRGRGAAGARAAPSRAGARVVRLRRPSRRSARRACAGGRDLRRARARDARRRAGASGPPGRWSCSRAATTSTPSSTACARS